MKYLTLAGHAEREYAPDKIFAASQKAKAAIDKVSAANAYTVVFDTSTGSLAYFDEATLTDIAPQVKKELGITDAPAAAPAAK